MTSDRIRDLVKLIPDDAPYVAGLPSSRLLDIRIPKLDKLSFCLNDPRFGWNFAKTFFEIKRPLPEKELHEEFIIRAYYYLWGEEDAEVEDALLFMDMRNFAARLGIDIHLLEPKLPLEVISHKLQVDLTTLTAYADLFFSFRHRLNSDLFMLNFIYPETRRVETQENYLMRESTEKLAQRMVYNFDLESGKKFVGFRESPLKDSESMESMRKLEAYVMSNGSYLAQLGGLNQRTQAGIRGATRILQAVKISGQDEKSDDSARGLTSISISHSMREALRESQDLDIRQRLLISQNEESQKRLEAAQRKSA